MNTLKFIFSLALFSSPFVGYTTEQEEFHWNKERTQCANIEVAIASTGVIQNYIQVPGRVKIHPDNIAYVVPKVHGVVKEIRKNVCDVIEKGEVLALVESQEMAEAKAHYLTALKKLIFQQALLKRENSLRGISAGQDYLNALLAEEEAVINCALATQNLMAFGLTENEIGEISQEDPLHLRLYAIKSPLQGKVLQRDLTLGELIDDTSKIFTIANFEKVWIEMSIPQSELHVVKEGLPMEIVVDGKRVHLKICQFNRAIHPETRMATAVAVVANAPGTWTTGEFITAFIQTGTLQAPVVVSKEAIQSIKGESYIFVENGEGFIPSRVKLGKMDESNVEIISGLIEGERYASQNTFCLKAEYEKEEE